MAKSKAPKIDPYVEGFLNKFMDRLATLEKKMDRLISQGASRAPQSSQPVPQPPPQPKRERQLYEAICADCSKVCEVPFRPSENRAVYCKACWAKRKGQAPGMPILRPVELPPKPAGKLGQPIAPIATPSKAKKPKKSAPKKSKKKK